MTLKVRVNVAQGQYHCSKILVSDLDLVQKNTEITGINWNKM